MAEVKRLFTCGDSFMSVDAAPAQVTSFLELFARYRGYHHVTLARPGATNYLIRLQIDYAIKHRADFVIVSCTSSDRFDVPTSVDRTNRPDLQIVDTPYRGYRAASEEIVTSTDNFFISDTIYNLEHDKNGPCITPDQKTALKYAVSELHNPTLQRHKDFYIIRDGLSQLTHHGIPFVFLPAAMNMFDWSQFKIIWPTDIMEPYDLVNKQPYDYDITVTHNDQPHHTSFCQTLLDITPDWV